MCGLDLGWLTARKVSRSVETERAIETGRPPSRIPSLCAGLADSLPLVVYSQPPTVKGLALAELVFVQSPEEEGLAQASDRMP